MTVNVTFGLTTFGDIDSQNDFDQSIYSSSIINIVNEAKLADQVGIDFFGVGEHHRADFSVSAPEIVLSNIAGKTKRIRIGTTATVLPTDDPVRLFQRFATLDAVSGGRAELVLGRGWFNEAFSLFGFDSADSSALFEHKLNLFRQIYSQGRIDRSGDGRAPLSETIVYPRMLYDPLKVWVAVGSTPDSALRAARYGFPMMLAIIGGPPARFKPMVDLYRLACMKLNKLPLEIGIHSSGYVAETDTRAQNDFWPHYEKQRNSLGKNRGWPGFTKEKFLNEVAFGSLYVGSPNTVAKRIAETLKIFDCSRIHIKYSCGGMPHDQLLQSIELMGSQVLPLVREY